MDDFKALLAILQNPGEEGAPETIYDDLDASYNDRVSAGDAKIAELSAALEESNGKLQKVMAHNYELLTAVQTGNPEGARGDLDDTNESEETDAEIISLDDIVTYS